MTQFNFQQHLQTMQQQFNAVGRQLTKTRQAVCALEAESILRAKKREPKLPLEFTSQFGEDILAWTLLNKQDTGFFIEAGAFDGYHYSVTYPFEAVGWQGLLVEAIPQRADECAKRRPGSRVVNALLSPDGPAGSAKFWVTADQYGGMLSYSKMTPQRQLELGNTPRQEITIPCASLNTLLADHRGPIDLVVLDLEGDELDALRGFDIARFRPRLLVIEDNTRGQDQAVKNFMLRLGYQAAGRLAVNDIFIRTDEKDILDRFKWML